MMGKDGGLGGKRMVGWGFVNALMSQRTMSNEIIEIGIKNEMQLKNMTLKLEAIWTGIMANLIVGFKEILWIICTSMN